LDYEEEDAVLIFTSSGSFEYEKAMKRIIIALLIVATACGLVGFTGYAIGASDIALHLFYILLVGAFCLFIFSLLVTRFKKP